ncbi:MAG: acetylglutamate kinase [Planctomycetes bacterium]|nr:acetylglutamate kinase [Planctomycetota bacterium]
MSEGLLKGPGGLRSRGPLDKGKDAPKNSDRFLPWHPPEGIAQGYVAPSSQSIAKPGGRAVENYEFIINFFKNIGASKEANMYLRLFKKGNPSRFAVIKVGGKTLTDSMPVLSGDLAYLTNLDLFPIIVHGGGPQIDRELDVRRIEFAKKDGLRVTSKEAVDVIREVLEDANRKLVDAIRSQGGDAEGVRTAVRAKRHADPDLGYVGEVTGIDLKPIFRAIRMDRIPVVSPVGFDENGEPLNVNADTVARALVMALRPKKFILLTDEGGVRDPGGKIVPFINLTADLQGMQDRGEVTGGMALKLRETKQLLEDLPTTMFVTITSPHSLIKELFTVKGSGTFIKLGSEIEEHHSWKGINRDRMRTLIEASFGRKLVSNYFQRDVTSIFLDPKYRGCAIMRKVAGMDYLDKFAVRKEAQGEGMGRDVWGAMLQKYPKLFWRSKSTNPINSWYFEQSSGAIKFADWTVFWIGLRESQIKKAIRAALKLPPTLQDAARTK